MQKAIVRTESYREELLESLKDPEEAAHYLSACLVDQDPWVFLLALRDVADAHGGVRAVSRETRLNRESLYRMLSKAGNPSLDSLAAVLQACGLRLAVQSADPKRGKRRTAPAIAPRTRIATSPPPR
jgi:probable addiction module antidote protein